MAETYDVAVVGGGPAGLAAAVTAAESGRRVLLVDAAGQTGGQYWRHPQESARPEDDPRGHHDWSVYRDLRSRLQAVCRRGRVDYRPWTTVWLLERTDGAFLVRTKPTLDTPGEPGTASGGPGANPDGPDTGTDRARRLVLCPGAYDRQLPVPGWDLPGVLAAGGAQALLKGYGVVAGRRVVVAGTGPFLLPVAAGLSDAGADVVALCEAADPTRWVRHLRAAARQPAKLLQGAEYTARLARRGVRLRTRTTVTEVLGQDRVTGVRLARLTAEGTVRPGTERVVEADVVALGWGFTPQLELPLMLGARTALGEDGSLVVQVDAEQRTSVPDLYVAGEATGVGGATLAVEEGLVAGRAAAGGPPEARALARVHAHRSFARAMHDVYPVPRRWTTWVTPETLVCRCEEVDAGALTCARRDLQADDPRTARSTTRAGMGRCQGRVCGYATAALLAGAAGRTMTEEDLLATGRRPLAASVPLGALAALDGRQDHEQEEAPTP